MPYEPSLDTAKDQPASLLDPRALLAACGENGVILGKIAETLRAHLPPELSRAAECLRQRDAAALREAAHRLAGMVSAVSTIAGTVATTLEDQAALGELGGAPELLEQLGAMVRDVLADVEHTTIEHLQRLVERPNLSTPTRARD